MNTDPLKEVRENLAGLMPPFYPTHGNSVLDQWGVAVCEQLYPPGRDKLIAGALNYVTTKHDEQIIMLCAHLLVELGYAIDPRLDLQAPMPRLLTIQEAQKMVWDYMVNRDWDKLVADSLR